MKFIYTDHVKLRIEQRGLSFGMIEATVSHPDGECTSFKDRQIARKKFRGKILEVIYRKQGISTVIITAYWQKKE